MDIKIRMASENDAEEILRIYAPYVKNTIITFEYEVPTVDEFKKRIRKISKDYPYLVCTLDDKIIGYAYSYRHKERAAYQWNVELSVYIDNAYLRYGLGKAFYTALIEISKLQNIKNIYGVVTSNNMNSEKLHEYFGFKKLGIYYNTGYKFGKWHDVTWFEKSINEEYCEPKPLKSIKDVDNGLVNEIIEKCYNFIKL
ncbi:GNAT family N-acetyltransferase [Clostridium tertium]|uniref:GNAT family N-acetyltransferase n=1 Tax=Clostridium tertium TaxID=1559 RepID=UPI002330B367|nr:GNAT family N-acetyltransferase [Clostridium tertium]MDB1955991.1 GNAT family N-acetyltransferase [Clostridium tertium]MDB1960124.1 GNAT family N-acetyltransferase [Clostridium tertium]MDB1962572.1 GNAT family N-acetyltransferase [Clostridium tertium]MDB1967136.1 GNAT family N-acetyltransferase [Clostridium tertium]